MAREKIQRTLHFFELKDIGSNIKFYCSGPREQSTGIYNNTCFINKEIFFDSGNYNATFCLFTVLFEEIFSINLTIKILCARKKYAK